MRGTYISALRFVHPAGSSLIWRQHAAGRAQVLFQDGRLQWKRLENLISLAREGSAGLDLSDTVRDGARVVLMDDRLRTQLLMALTEDDRLHVAVRLCFC